VIVLSHVQARPILAAREAAAARIEVSPDLGLTTVIVGLEPDRIRFPDGEWLGWDALAEIAANEGNCFAVGDGTAQKIVVFSEATNRVYSLFPTASAPTMLVSGIPMHRIKGTNPHQDTLEKIRAIQPVVGQVLDTAPGLGYTAIEASKTAEHVITIELDPAALEVARLNPWSRGLFDNPKITQLIGDSFDVIERLPDETFTRIIHDPPVLALAGHLYSGEFYAELYRVRRRRGRLFHYVGDPESKSGQNATRGVLRRLQAAGFARVHPYPRAFGVVAVK